jgi:hypothetical protein
MVSSPAQHGMVSAGLGASVFGIGLGSAISAAPTNAPTNHYIPPNLPKTNPPFSGSVAGAAPHTVDNVGAGKIVRGYIRRENNTDKTDLTSSYRLNFMYNPESIQRQFIAYLDQGALDPFNTVHGSGNIAAPPGILDFSFELLFDRQLEVARDDRHPGTKVDYDYFDLVVRGVLPGVGATPDNGVMMVNPRNITVVFSPQLLVTGKPYNASVSFDKFSHKMTPTRIRVLMQMKVLSIGPRPISYTYQTSQAQADFTATVPYDNQVSVNVKHSEDADAANALGNASTLVGGFGLDWGGTSPTAIGGGVGANVGGASVGVSASIGGSNAERIWNYLRGKGLTVNQTAGILGNISAESDFDPGQQEVTSRASKGYGIVQWTFGRRVELENFAKSAGKPVSDLDLQLAFLWTELTGSYRSSVLVPLQSTTTIQDAVIVWLKHYEIPQDISGQTPVRIGRANAVLRNGWAK